MINTNKTSVTVIGLGLMGQALATALLRSGHPTTVWNRTSSKADALVAKGARLAPSIDEALNSTEVTFICLTDYAAVHQLLDPSAPRLDGRLLINLTSGDSAQAREAARWAEQHGARYLDGAIMALPAAIGTETATILISGEPSTFESGLPALQALGSPSHLGADHGLAALYDVAGLGLMWSLLNAWLHGVALLRTAGVDAATFTPFAAGIAAEVCRWLPGYAAQIDTGEYPAEDASLDTHVASMAHLIEESRALGVNDELPKLIKDIAGRSIAAGHGGHSYPALIEEFAKARE
jgi:3-hydroxyisobutyrate dehydrogenase-like beta-hydroxyacid dehydrogenase